MAYLNEFPHTEASKLNLDWILEQYSTFNERLAEIVQHFDESVAQMESDILQFKGEYETAFNNYKSDINHLMENFETTIEGAIEQFENDINDEVDSIRDVIEIVNKNTEQYINENIQSFMWNVVTTTLEKSASVSPDGNATINFDSYTIPEGYASFVILEYNEQYQNNVWVGGNINPGDTVGVFPSLRYSKSGDNYNFTMNVYNPVSGGALDVTARIKLLLIPDTTMI